MKKIVTLAFVVIVTLSYYHSFTKPTVSTVKKSTSAQSNVGEFTQPTVGSFYAFTGPGSPTEIVDVQDVSYPFTIYNASGHTYMVGSALYVTLTVYFNTTGSVWFRYDGPLSED